MCGSNHVSGRFVKMLSLLLMCNQPGLFGKQEFTEKWKETILNYRIRLAVEKVVCIICLHWLSYCRLSLRSYWQWHAIWHKCGNSGLLCGVVDLFAKGVWLATKQAIPNYKVYGLYLERQVGEKEQPNDRTIQLLRMRIFNVSYE